MEEWSVIAQRMRAHVKAIECVHILRNCAKERLSMANNVARACREGDCPWYILKAADVMGQKAFVECGRWSNELRKLRAYEYFPHGSA
jgi:hypothetical protein